MNATWQQHFSNYKGRKGKLFTYPPPRACPCFLAPSPCPQTHRVGVILMQVYGLLSCSHLALHMLYVPHGSLKIYIYIYMFSNCITPWLLLELFCLRDCECDGQWTPPPQDFYPGKQRGGISSCSFYLGRVGLSLGCPHHLLPWNKLERMLSIPPQVV